MSILDTIREKYKTPISETDKTDKRAFVSSVGPTDRQIKSFSHSELRAIAGDDWPEISTIPGELIALEAVAQTAAQVRRGGVPAHYTATTTCANCGLVPIFAGLPAQVAGCPWCLVRVAGGTVPRPAP